MNSKSLAAFLSPFDGANAASAAGVPGCGVSPPYMFLYVTPLSVPLYVIYYYIAWRTFLFGLRTDISSAGRVGLRCERFVSCEFAARTFVSRTRHAEVDACFMMIWMGSLVHRLRNCVEVVAVGMMPDQIAVDLKLSQVFVEG